MAVVAVVRRSPSPVVAGAEPQRIATYLTVPTCAGKTCSIEKACHERDLGRDKLIAYQRGSISQATPSSFRSSFGAIARLAAVDRRRPGVVVDLA
ncbi:hypothetical protein [Aldersonia kunmingensis]|uniref:hypothetical protein n=1 Tax=Aldersonia kunmingensis TaxID=408066 RepID=UPI003CCC1DB9